MATNILSNDENPRTLRQIVQKKFLDEVIGVSEQWKVLVLDDFSTVVISSALTMFDIMERRITTVESLKLTRRPFPDMEVIYFITPSIQSVKSLVNDFNDPRKPRYGPVHVIFTDTIPQNVMTIIQSNGNLVQRIKTFKEIYLDFQTTESNVFTLDLKDTLSKLYGSLTDPSYPQLIGNRLANICITLNEHPLIRYQQSSNYSKIIAVTLHEKLTQFKKLNTSFWYNGDDTHHDRDRSTILILDRSFDPLSPLMHEYTYQSMVNDLLQVENNVIKYKTQNNNNKFDDKESILNDNDELWTELKYEHIAKVIEIIKNRMSDIINNNKNAVLTKKSDAEVTITAMAAAVKQLPEYQQTMNRLGQHVAIAQQCMDAFSSLGLMEISQIEQTISTRYDEDGKEVKNNKLLQLVIDLLSTRTLTNDQKIRLLAIYILSQRNASNEEKRQLYIAAGLSDNGNIQQVLLNFERLLVNTSSNPIKSTNASTSNSIFSLFRKNPVKHDPTPEGEYADTRHVPLVKILTEQLITNELAADQYPYINNTNVNNNKIAKSVRKVGNHSRWDNNNKNDIQFDGGRLFVFISGGIAYSELRSGYELMVQHKKEIILGSTDIVNPKQYIESIKTLDSTVSTTGRESTFL